MFMGMMMPLLTNPDFAAKVRPNFLNGPYEPLDPEHGHANLMRNSVDTQWAFDWASLDLPVLSITGLHDRVYRDPEAHWSMYELAEKLVDLEDYFRRWRFNHVTTVSRIIGMKRGTGGTSGVSYLQKMLQVELFPELWVVRTDL